MVAGQTKADLKTRAKTRRRGHRHRLSCHLATMAFFCAAVFIALNKKHGIELSPLVLARSARRWAGWRCRP